MAFGTSLISVLPGPSCRSRHSGTPQTKRGRTIPGHTPVCSHHTTAKPPRPPSRVGRHLGAPNPAVPLCRSLPAVAGASASLCLRRKLPLKSRTPFATWPPAIAPAATDLRVLRPEALVYSLACASGSDNITSLARRARISCAPETTTTRGRAIPDPPPSNHVNPSSKNVGHETAPGRLLCTTILPFLLFP